MALTRRELLKLFAASSAAIVVSSGLHGCGGSSSSSNDDETDDNNDGQDTNTVSFNHGVASGDPLSTQVIIWTRVSPTKDEAVSVSWEVATDSNFSNLVNTDSASVSNDTDYTLKVDVTGLTAGTDYYYRFTSNGTTSATGMTKTLPTTATQAKFAVFSCANFPAGFFHVYADAATQSDLDAVLHLGDYIYEYDKEGYPAAGTGEDINRVHSPETECLALADYRTRYAQYRTDTDLQDLHAKVPFICVWDDHEIANDTYKDGAENHDTATEGGFTERRAEAIQAWYEWLPVRAPAVEEDKIKTYRRFDYANIASLMMLDTRVVGRDVQLDYADYMDAQGNLDAAAFTADITDTSRTILGADQLTWLQGEMQSSKTSGVAWQVLGQQVLMGRMTLPASILIPDPETGLPDPQNLLNYQSAALAYSSLVTAVVTDMNTQGDVNTFAAGIDGFAEMTETEQGIALTEALKVADEDRYNTIFATQLTTDEQTALATYGALLDTTTNPFIPYNLDAWDGYAVEREVLLGTAASLSSNLVVLSGDTHNAWATHLTDQNGNNIGVEFATSSVSSPGMEQYLSIQEGAEAATEAGIVQLVSDLQYFNSSQRGYAVVTFTETSATADWYFMARNAEKTSTKPTFTNSQTLMMTAGTSELTAPV